MRSRLRVPGMGTTNPEALTLGEKPSQGYLGRSCIQPTGYLANRGHDGLVRIKCLITKTGDLMAEVILPKVARANGSRKETAAKRRIRHEPNAKFLGCRNNVELNIPAPD